MSDVRSKQWVDEVTDLINSEGGGPGSSLHSWRCEYPDRYGPCDCVESLAQEIVALIDRKMSSQT